MKSVLDRDRCAPASAIHASRQASHSSGTIWFLHAASGKGTKDGRAVLAAMFAEIEVVIVWRIPALKTPNPSPIYSPQSQDSAHLAA
jgi:hypothetical protein